VKDIIKVQPTLKETANANWRPSVFPDVVVSAYQGSS